MIMLAVIAMLVVSDPVDTKMSRPYFLVNYFYYMLMYHHNTARNNHEKWLQKRWRELCKGGGRYQAMGEAYEMGRPDPCNGAKEWKKVE